MKQELSVFEPSFAASWRRFEEAVELEVAGDESLVGLSRWASQLLVERPELKLVWIASEFVANWCIRSPRRLYTFLSSGALDGPREHEPVGVWLNEALVGVEDETQLAKILRDCRNQEMVRIAWRDLAGFSNVEETMADVSALADACVHQALTHHERWLNLRFGFTMGQSWLDTNPGNENAPLSDEDIKQRAQMVVLGMGKLGGNELNYSSDIDLIFAYEEGGETRPGPDQTKIKSISNQEFFIKLGRKIIAALDPVTPDGFVFRTDMRLRPNGDSGPLVLSLAAMEHYYQTHGRGWERYAFIKARVVAGSQSVGHDLMQMLRPFVYRKYLDFSAFDSIREMKRMISQALKKKGAEDDIKLGQGGIREIEFLIQSHQLIRGGRERKLQTASLYTALEALVDLGVAERAVSDGLLEAYRFLRNTEHRLQMVQDRQTQQLPQDDTDRHRLAVSMGFSDWSSYFSELDRHRMVVHYQFRQILETSDESEQVATPVDNTFANIWNEIADKEFALEGLAQVGFPNPSPIYQMLKGFKDGRLYQVFSGKEKNRIDRLMPLALKEAVRYPEYERATSAFIGVIESIGRRAVYLSLLIENPLALKQLLHLCAASPWISRHIGQHPVVMDELLNPISGICSLTKAELTSRLKKRLHQLDPDDEEAKMNLLREFHHGHVLQVAAADVLGLLEVEDIAHSLGMLAEVVLAEVFHESIQATKKKLSAPDLQAGVIAYGKFASHELGYHSDLDIVVCFGQYQRLIQDGGHQHQTGNTHSGEAEYFYSRVSRRMIHWLTMRTPSGILYELDMRLRPSGRRGTLVTSLQGFLEYQLNSAWTWEHQALVRARAVAGDAVFAEQFEAVRAQVLCLRRDPDQLREDIITMRRRMVDANSQSTATHYDIKLDRGGIVDIEFLVQYWILRHGADHPSLTKPRATSDTLDALVAHSVIPETTGESIKRIYRCYLRKSLDMKLMDSPVLIEQNQLIEERQLICDIWEQTLG